ncbi:hypothetical protein FAGAP_9784 [Fusarium agapanthi]|uniref:Uncharacterized protein n=1 Tax=Fusarium agapanthi TaxID=1803897 RepID=A0A9P5E483_9HYPO|nr:hypothetical protein FAGAP_9784 [Fusarium agapanthi]
MDEERYDYHYQGMVAYIGEMLGTDMSHVIAEYEALPPGVLPEPVSLPDLATWWNGNAFVPFTDSYFEEVDGQSPGNEGDSAVKVEPASPDTLAAPESPRSPYLYDIPPFRRSQTLLQSIL